MGVLATWLTGSPEGRLLAALPPWAWVVFLSLPLRLPLVLRPEPGRDEAAYFYWSRHLELAYAPLLQLSLKLASLLPVPDLVALRLPSVVAGVLLLALFDRWMVLNEASLRVRWTGLAAVALCPWHVFTGSVLHPDGLFVSALLAFVLAAATGRRLLLSLALVGMVWAKPAGFLLLPAAVWFIARHDGWHSWSGCVGLALMAIGVAPVAASWSPDMVGEVLRFGTSAADSPPVERFVAYLFWTVLSGGLLLLGGVHGLHAVARRAESGSQPREVALWTALSILIAFGAAALLRGQFKPNWVLPAFLVLWPFAPALPRRGVRWGLAAAAACSLFVVSAVQWPDRMRLAASPGPESLAHAGLLAPEVFEREVLEWKSIEPFASAVERALLDPRPDDGRPVHVVSDDYGLAMQLAYRWRRSGVTVDVPASALFRGRPAGGDAPTLLLTSDAGAVGSTAPALQVPHPATGEIVYLALAEQAADPPPAPPQISSAHAELHAPFDTLLARYRTEAGVRYEAWTASMDDLTALSSYVDGLEAETPSVWERDEALAYWINLYNAATLELVLTHYPIKSIKDIGGPLSNPWKRDVVRVEGKNYNLDAIEHDVIRKQFTDPRIHFALNCASVGCPPLAPSAYRADSLDADLDRACRVALQDARWAEVTAEEIRLTQLFDWYRGDFERNRGSVREFVARYRPADRGAILDTERRIVYLGYAWDLNEVR